MIQENKGRRRRPGNQWWWWWVWSVLKQCTQLQLRIETKHATVDQLTITNLRRDTWTKECREGRKLIKSNASLIFRHQKVLESFVHCFFWKKMCLQDWIFQSFLPSSPSSSASLFILFTILFIIRQEWFLCSRSYFLIFLPSQDCLVK